MSTNKKRDEAMKKLTKALIDDGQEDIVLSFEMIEKIIGCCLQRKQRRQQWWTNKPGNAQSVIWREANYLVNEKHPIESNRSVYFKKREYTKAEKLKHRILFIVKKVLPWLLSAIIIPILIQTFLDYRSNITLVETIKTAYEMEAYDEVESLIMQNVGNVDKLWNQRQIVEVYAMLLDSITKASKDSLIPEVELYDDETMNRMLSVANKSIDCSEKNRYSKYVIGICSDIAQVCCNQYISTMNIEFLTLARQYIVRADRYMNANGIDSIEIKNTENYLLSKEIFKLRYRDFLYDFYSIVYAYQTLDIDDVNTDSFIMGYSKVMGTAYIIDDCANGIELYDENEKSFYEIRTAFSNILAVCVGDIVGFDIPPTLLIGVAFIDPYEILEENISSVISYLEKKKEYRTLSLVHLARASILYHEGSEEKDDIKIRESRNNIQKALELASKEHFLMTDYEHFFESPYSIDAINTYIYALENEIKDNGYSDNKEFRAYIHLKLGEWYFNKAILQTEEKEDMGEIVSSYGKAYEYLNKCESFYPKDEYSYIRNAIEQMKSIITIAFDDVDLAYQKYLEISQEEEPKG